MSPSESRAAGTIAHRFDREKTGVGRLPSILTFNETGSSALCGRCLNRHRPRAWALPIVRH